MKKELKYLDAEHKIIVCACSDPSHQIVLSKYKGEPFEGHELWLTVRIQDDGFWYRLKNLFKKKLNFAELLITHTEAEQFIEALQKFNTFES